MAVQCVTYQRVSPRPQENDSIQRQRDECNRFCAAKGWEVIGDYSDNLKSGATMRGRTGLAAALEVVRREQAILVCYSWDRISRSLVEGVALAEALHKRGVDIWQVEGGQIKLAEPAQWLAFVMQCVVAEYQRRGTAQVTRSALARKRRLGHRTSRHIEYGWMLDPHKMGVTKPASRDKTRQVPYLLCENEREQGWIRFILEARGRGESHVAIARQLNVLGAPRGVWTGRLVERVCRRSEPADQKQ